MQIVSESYDGIPNGVLCTTKDLTAMARVWPCSGLRSGTMIIFEFDNHGNLCDIEWLDDDGVTCSEPAGIDQYSCTRYRRMRSNFWRSLVVRDEPASLLPYWRFSSIQCGHQSDAVFRSVHAHANRWPLHGMEDCWPECRSTIRQTGQCLVGTDHVRGSRFLSGFARHLPIHGCRRNGW